LKSSYDNESLWYTPGNQFPLFSDLQDKQYLVVRYRTTSQCNGQIRFDSFPNPGNEFISFDADWKNTGEWTFAVFDISDMASVYHPESMTVVFRMIIFDDSCNSTDTFDLAYAAFFDSREEAESFMARFG